MKRLYIIHESEWETPVQFKDEPEPKPLWHAFNGSGCQWWDLGDGHRIVCGDFVSEDREAVWNSHGAVTHLHHPTKEKSLPVGKLLTVAHAHKRFAQKHIELLSNALGVTADDTMETLNEKISAVHPGCAIYATTKTAKAQTKSSKWIY